MLSRVALASIYAYQTWISPRKGYRCAHSVLHGGTGCSGFAKYAIRDHGFFRALPAIRQRFADCRAASVSLRQSCAVHSRPLGPNDDEDYPGAKKNNRSCKRDIAESACYACDGISCLPAAGCGILGLSGSGADAATGGASAGCDMCGGADCAPSCDCFPSCG